MRHKLNIFFLSAMVLLLAAGCAVTDYDRTADFHSYRTFAWGESDIQVDNPVYDSDLINKNIRATVEKEFSKRGIVEDKINPDFIVSYTTYTEEKQKADRGVRPYAFHPYAPFWYYGFGFWGFPYYGHQPQQTYNYTAGTLIIDIQDSASNDLIWRGTVEGNVENVGNLQKQIQKGIKAIMKKYPVTPADAPLLKNEDAIS